MRWAFWRARTGAPPEPPRALPDDVGLPTTFRPPRAPTGPDDPDEDDRPAGATPGRTSGANPGATPTPHPTSPAPLADPDASDLDRAALAAAGPDLTEVVRTGAPATSTRSDVRTLAVAATGALAARLPALSGVDDAPVFDEPEDELLHAYADLLVTRAQARRTTPQLDPEDLLAVAHLAAAAVAVDAAADPALLLLAGMPADLQLRAAARLLAQTAEDGGGPPDALAGEVGALFGAAG